MNIKCKKEILSEALSVVSRAVSSKTSLPALEGILLRCFENEVELIGYDLDTGIRTIIDAEILETGEIVIPARMLVEIVRKMPGEEITITTGEKFLIEITSDAAKYTILGMSSDEFPEFPKVVDVSQITVSQRILKGMIEQTLFAISQNDSKPVHKGSLFELNKSGEMRVVSVDGFRLAVSCEVIKIVDDIKFVIPGKTLIEISRILSENEDMAELSISRKHAIIDVGAFRFYSRLLEGDFLDYKVAIPKKSVAKVKINVMEFIEAVERASLLISDKVKSPVRLKFLEKEVIITCSTALGKSIDSVSCEMQEGEEIEMGFNNKYILDALKNSFCDEVILDISGALSPMKVLPIEGNDFVFLVLPVRI